MIDTLHLILHEPVIRKADNRLLITPLGQRNGIPAGKNIRVVYDDGTTEQVKEVELHDDDLLQLSSSRGRYRLRFSVAKMETLGKHNATPVSKGEAVNIFEFVEEYLREVIGLRTDLNKAVITRLDIFGNARTPYGFQLYRPLFDLLKFRFRKGECWQSSHLRYNTQRAAAIYDKFKELGCDVTEHVEKTPVDPKTLRWEQRRLTPRAVQRLDIITVGDLLDRWDSVRQEFNDQVYGALRFDLVMDIDTPAVSYPERLRSLMRRPRDTRALRLLLLGIGARDLFGALQGFDGLREALLAAGYKKRGQVDKMLREMARYRMIRLPEETVSLNDLREELYTSLRTE